MFSLSTETIPPELILENYERRSQHVLFDRLDYLIEFLPGIFLHLLNILIIIKKLLLLLF